MLLGDIVSEAGLSKPDGDLAVDVTDVTHDSRQVERGVAFACIRGESHDGHQYAAKAVNAGAPALIVDHELSTGIPELVVPDVRRAVGPLAAIVHHKPSYRVPVVGVTGTSGKTTVTHLLGAIFEAAGMRSAVMGTLSGKMTTPEGTDLQRQLATAVADGAEAIAMEVSSHALSLHRVDGTRFAVSTFTNLGRDHLDFHQSMDEYFEAKSRLFESSLCEVGVVNRDDEWGMRLIRDAEANPDSRCPVRPFGIDDVSEIEMSAGGSSFLWHGTPMTVRLPGMFNVLNAIAAATAAAELSLPESAIAAGIAAVPSVRGRFEVISNLGAHVDDIDVIVDYAHKPEALVAVLEAAREISSGKIVVVAGAAGDRDKTKRPLMGRAAAALSDKAIITSDNPRSEDPDVIIAEVVAGIDSKADVVVEPDRAVAIQDAIANAGVGDLVVIAGKGHETTQTTGDSVVEFDDADHAARALSTRRSRA